MNHPLFEIVKTTTGAISIRNKVLGETMHSPVGPWLEANLLYIDQSKLKDKLQTDFDTELVIFDVGLGAAANALAAIHGAREVWNKSAKKRKLKIVSFERDLTLMEFALSEASHFEHFTGFEKAITELLKNSIWKRENLTWELRHGDFVNLIEQESEKAHIIFYDPYSPKMNKDMWTARVFKNLFEKCQRDNNQSAQLYTYSRATPIRSALLLAGFFVGAGSATGLKDETTQAATRISDLVSPLGERWLARFKKSQTPLPFDLDKGDEGAKNLILAHPQFIYE